MIKRIALGFAVAGLVVPATAQARIDEGISGQPNTASENSAVKSGNYIPFGTDFPSYASQSVRIGTPSGLPHAGLNDYLQARDGIEVARLNPQSTLRTNDLVEQVRVAPREVSTPQAVASPGFDWRDAGIGAGLALGLVLLGAAAVRASRNLGKAQTA